MVRLTLTVLYAWALIPSIYIMADRYALFVMQVKQPKGAPEKVANGNHTSCMPSEITLLYANVARTCI